MPANFLFFRGSDWFLLKVTFAEGKDMIRKVSKRVDPKILIGLFVVFALGLTIFYLSPYGKFLRLMKTAVKEEKQRKVHLLSETDHQALLEACRELSGRVSAGDLEANNYLFRYKPHPETLRFPQLILDLEPMRISIKDDRSIMVEMHGGFHHYGVIAYHENFEYGDKKIIDGLWYYEDGYNPSYNKWIEKMIQKEKMRRQAEQETASRTTQNTGERYE